MSRKQIVILVALGLFVILAVVVGFIAKSNKSSPGLLGEGKVIATTILPSGEEVLIFSQEVPEDAKLTIPTSESVAAPGREERAGTFEMTVGSNGFNPSSITVTKGDSVFIRLTAQGGHYDFSFPYNGNYVDVKDGEMKQVSFGVNAVGTYAFMCRDFCPSGKTISGEIIVLP